MPDLVKSPGRDLNYIVKRPFLLAGVLSLILSFAALYMGEIWVIVFLCFVLLGSIVLFLIKRKLFLRQVIPLMILIFAILNSFSVLKDVKKAENIPLGEINLKGVVTEAPEIYPNGQAMVIKGQSFNGKAWVFSNVTYDIKAGDNISLVVDVQKMEDSLKANNYSKGIYLNGFLHELRDIKRPKFSTLRFIADFREKIENTIFQKTNSENAPLLIALATGNKNYINTSDQRAINNAGVSHIMAVSGLHLGIICLSLTRLLRKLKINHKIIGICGIATVFLVLLACGFQISAIRASVVYIILLLGGMIHRKGDALNSLFVAITLIIAANPLVIGSASFLLSISSTFGIIVLYPLIHRLLGGIKQSGNLGKVLNAGWDIALVSFSAIICSMPVMAYIFESVSIASILVNVLVLYAANIVLVLTVIGLLVSIIPIINILSVLFFLLAQWGMEYFMAVVKFFGKDSALLYMKQEMFIFWLIFDAAIIIFSYLGVKKLDKTKRSDLFGSE